jgi:hypothetical protein
MTGSAQTPWQTVSSFLDAKSAHTFAALLRAEQIRAQVSSDPTVLGVAVTWDVLVHPEDVSLAQSLIEGATFTEAELAYLSTGKLGGDEGSG